MAEASCLYWLALGVKFFLGKLAKMVPWKNFITKIISFFCMLSISLWF